MTKLALALLFAFVLVLPSGFATTFKLPDGKPVVSITIPPTWKPEKIPNGVQGQTDDDGVYIAGETTNTEKGMNAIIDGTFAMLKDRKIDLKKGSRKETKFDINGLKADELLYEGSDQDGPTIVSITFITIGKDTVLVFTYWTSPEAEKTHDNEIKSIVQSIKEIK